MKNVARALCAAAFLFLFASAAATFSPASASIRPTTTTSNDRRAWSLTSVNTALHLERRSVLLETVVATASTLLSVPPPPPSPRPTARTRLWLDADPSGFVWTGLDCDDDLAILLALAIQRQSSNRIQLEGISVCGGNAPLRHTRKDMNALLTYADAASLGPEFAHYYTGYGWRDMQISRKWLQRLNRLQPDIISSDEASRAIIKAAYDSSNARSNDDSKLTVLTLGPPTNLAKALEQDPTLASRIEHVYMMGGELTQQRLDLNFASDRAAARTIVNADVPTTLVPVQLCAQVVLDGLFVDEFERDYCINNSSNGEKAAATACALLPKMRQQVRTMPELVNQAVKNRVPHGKRWRASPNLDRGFIPWDIVAVLSVSHPELFDEWEYHRAEFPTCIEGEPCDRTMVVHDLPRNEWPSGDNYGGGSNAKYNDHSGIVRIPHVLKSEAEVKALVQELLGQVLANPQMRRQPGIMLGFLAPVGAVVSGTLATFIGRIFGKMNS